MPKRLYFIGLLVAALSAGAVRAEFTVMGASDPCGEFRVQTKPTAAAIQQCLKSASACQSVLKETYSPGKKELLNNCKPPKATAFASCMFMDSVGPKGKWWCPFPPGFFDYKGNCEANCGLL